MSAICDLLPLMIGLLLCATGRPSRGPMTAQDAVLTCARCYTIESDSRTSGFIDSRVSVVKPYPGMVIRRNAKFLPGVYDFSSGRGITIAASNITVDGNGATLAGPGQASDPNSFIGTAVYADGVSGVTLKNLTAKGFQTGLHIKRGSRWKILGNNFSGNFNDPAAGWGVESNYGAIWLERLNDSIVAGNTGDNVWNGLSLYYCKRNGVAKDHFSPCSNVCLKMYASSHNTIEDNNMSWGIRISPGETHARDSASALIETGSNHNTFRRNDFTHGGDGVFIRSLNQIVSTGNYFYDNDASYAHNNAWECWSPGNRFEKNKANYSSYGFWLGGSDHTVLIDNEAAYNGTINKNAPEPFGLAGIAVWKGGSSHFICSGNYVHDNNGVGIAIGYKPGYEAFHWVIQRNTIANNSSYGIYMKNAKWLDIAGNEFSGNGRRDVFQDSNVTDVFQRTAGIGDELPRAIAAVSTRVAGVGAAISFDASKSFARAATTALPNDLRKLHYRWSLGDGTISDRARLTHSYSAPGFYRVGVTVDDGRLADLAWFDIYVVSGSTEIGTEGQAREWGASRISQASASAGLVDDRRIRITGSSSIRMTAKSRQVSFYFPRTRHGRIKLSGHAVLEFWTRSENTAIDGWKGTNPKVELCRDDSNCFTYTPHSDLFSNPPFQEARNGWQYVSIPVKGDSFWTRSRHGDPSLGRIGYIEFKTNGADSGYTVWIDGLGIRSVR